MLEEDRLTTFHAWIPTGKRVLVLAPHPDDETIGCGGTLRLHAMAGDPVKVVFLTKGGRGDVRNRHSKSGYVARRCEEARKACERLGITDLEFWNHEDREVAAAAVIADQVATLLAAYRPQLVYAPSPFEIHPDHRAACEWLRRALDKQRDPPAVAYCEVSQPLAVNRLVDISRVIDSKLAALRCYQSQLEERPYDRVSLGLNRFRTLTLYPPAEYAEGFLLMDGVTAAGVNPHMVSLMLASRYAVNAEDRDPDAPAPVSICLVVNGTGRALPAVFQAIAAQTHRRLEVCIVNRSGTDLEIMARLLLGSVPLRIVAAEANEATATLIGSGLDHGSGAYLIFIHDRCLLRADHVECLLRACEDGNADLSFSGMPGTETPPPLEACLFRRTFLARHRDRLGIDATEREVLGHLFSTASPKAVPFQTVDRLDDQPKRT